MGALEILKKLLAKKYEMKDLGEVKTIISCQITRDIAAHTIKIDQSVFIRDLVIKKRFTECNTNVIPMKAGSVIKIIKLDNYEETELREYERLIGKLMYLACDIRLNIAFVLGQLSGHNTDLKKGHL